VQIKCGPGTVYQPYFGTTTTSSAAIPKLRRTLPVVLQRC